MLYFQVKETVNKNMTEKQVVEAVMEDVMFTR